MPYNSIQLNQDDGYILKIVNYKNNIYIVQQYGISKLVISNGEYQIISNCSIKSSIFDNTIELIDDYVVFLTSSGLYIFDGNDLKQILKIPVIDFKSICGLAPKSIIHKMLSKLLFKSMLKPHSFP